MKKSVLIAIAAMTIGCMAGSNVYAESASDKMLQFCVDTFPSTMDPHEFSTITEYCIEYNIYEPLVYVKDDGSTENMLAESYEVSDDGTVYTFHIRQGVMFHDGSELTADDVVYSINRAIEDPYMATYVSAIAGVEKVDDATVDVTLAAASPSFLRLAKYISILNQEFCEANETLVSDACGTGPYALTDYMDGVYIELSAFADYWQGTPAIGGVVYNYIGDTATQTLSLESGDIDYLKVPASDWDRISSDPSFKSGSAVQDFVYWAGLNTETEALSDVRIRQAVAYAVNKEDAIAVAANGAGTVANVLADPRIIDGASDDFDYITYDPEKAKALLAEAGYADGLDVGDIIYIGGSTYEKIATSMQANLAAVGINASLRALDDSAIFDDIFAGNFSIVVFASGLGRDYSLYSQLYTTDYYGSLDICRVQDADVDAAFAEGAVMIDTEERQALYKELIEKLETGAYYVPVYYEDYIYACDPAFEPYIDDGGVMVYYSTWTE